MLFYITTFIRHRFSFGCERSMILHILKQSAFSFVFFGHPALAQNPPDVEKYICYQTNEPIRIDGMLDERDWSTANASSLFVDIEGVVKPDPKFQTKVKMLWNEEYFYIAAWLEEPHLWATYTQRESVIFHENDFEVFIDPDGDTHKYFEIEINALNTIWDLLLTKPYRDGGKPISSWDAEGMQTAVSLYGTINDPTDVDSCWTIEFAIPWRALKSDEEWHVIPKDGDQWKINFSRVQWDLDLAGNSYRKSVDPSTNKPFPENNWVWSPQCVVNMHRPETWGVVQFAGMKVGENTQDFMEDEDLECKWALRQLYYAQRAYWHQHKEYASELGILNLDIASIIAEELNIDITTSGYQASLYCNKTGTLWNIQQDGRMWAE
jgi:hypothetical protein